MCVCVWLQNRLLTFNAANLTAFMYLGCSGLFDFHLIWLAGGSVAFKNWHNNYAGNGQRNECRTRQAETNPNGSGSKASTQPIRASAAICSADNETSMEDNCCAHTQGVGGGVWGAGRGCVGVQCMLNAERLAIVHCTLQHILATNASVSAAPRRGISNPLAHPLPLRLFRLLLLFLLPLEATSGRLCCPNGV